MSDNDRTDLRPSDRRQLAAGLDRDRDRLWGLLYRMTGSAADADDLLQDVFERALRQPPDLSRPLGPWLTTVAMNLARDLLRRRKRRGYTGPWLPGVVDTERLRLPVPTPEARYTEMESVAFGFLVALEELNPNERAVLILRDVYDYSVQETAESLAMSSANVRTTHHRARRSIEAADATPRVAQADRSTREALEAMMAVLLSRDLAAFERMLSAEVRVRNDGGDDYAAARRPVVGRERVARFFGGLLASLEGGVRRVELREFNGQPGLYVELESAKPRHAQRFVVRLDLDAQGRIEAIDVLLADRKLAGVTDLIETDSSAK